MITEYPEGTVNGRRLLVIVDDSNDLDVDCDIEVYIETRKELQDHEKDAIADRVTEAIRNISIEGL